MNNPSQDEPSGDNGMFGDRRRLMKPSRNRRIAGVGLPGVRYDSDDLPVVRYDSDDVDFVGLTGLASYRYYTVNVHEDVAAGLYASDAITEMAADYRGVSVEKFKSMKEAGEDDWATDRVLESQLSEVEDEAAAIDNAWNGSQFRPKDQQPPSTKLAGLDLSKTDISNYQSRYAKAAKDGIDPLVQELLEEELNASDTLKGISRDHLAVIGRRIIATIETPILDAMLQGNLPALYYSNPEVRASVQKVWALRSSQPSCYGQWLVDKAGQSPTPAQLVEVLDYMNKYISPSNFNTNEISLRIDRVKSKRWPRNESEAGVRKYLSKAPNGYDFPSKDRVDQVSKFIDNLTARLDSLPATAHHVPLAAPLAEVGYSKNSEKRLKCHFAHLSSNYIMCLAEAVCEILFPGQFRMFQCVIFPIWSASMAVTAEIMLTRLCDGYTNNGGGFSHYLAGRSNDSALGLSEEAWRHLTNQAVKNTPWKSNVALITQRYDDISERETRRYEEITKQIESIRKRKEKLKKIAKLRRKLKAQQEAEKIGPEELEKVRDEQETEDFKEYVKESLIEIANIKAGLYALSILREKIADAENDLAELDQQHEGSPDNDD